MSRLIIMALTQATNDLPGHETPVTVSPEHHGTIKERQQLLRDLIGQLVDVFHYRFGHAVLAARRLYGLDVVIVRWVEQKVGEKRCPDAHRMKTDQADGGVGLAA